MVQPVRDWKIMSAVAIDTERVGLVGERGDFPIRVSIVDENLKLLLDMMINPTHPVQDFRTHIHGLTPEIVKSKGGHAGAFAEARQKILKLIRDKIVVGHDLTGDLKCCLIETEVPQNRRRDTACARMFAIEKVSVSGDSFYNKPSLKDMAKEHLNENIQVEKHSSVEDAITAMKIYKKFKGKSVEHWMPISG